MPAETRSKIRILDENTINQIAAGEVIENSTSVIKELIENAIDAGATSIDIETKAGGRQWIRIADNGCGMGKEDLILCLERHATSKIVHVDDLFSTGTLGFRGEALPSIASISKLMIHSSLQGGEGAFIRVEGGKILENGQAPRCQGTTVEVKGLFYNVPVRKHFQKSVAADTAEIHKLLTKIALSNSSIELQWKNDEKSLFHLQKNMLLEERVEYLLGKEIAQDLLPIEHSIENRSIVGLISKSHLHRPNRTGQFLFINHRPVVSNWVSERVLEGYGNRLPTHRYPLFVIFLNLPKNYVDVNVHPQKREVRLVDEASFGNLIKDGIEKSLQRNHSYELTTPISSGEVFSFTEAPFSYASQPQSSVSDTVSIEANTSLSPVKQTSDEVRNFFVPTTKIISWLGCFALVEIEGCTWIADPKAIQQRLFYERWVKKEKEVESQSLLFPHPLNLNAIDFQALEESKEILESLGFRWRIFSGKSVVIDALPSYFESEEIIPFFHHFFADIKVENVLKKEKLAFRFSALIKRKKVTSEELLKWIEKLLQLEMPYETVQGQVTLLPFSEKDIAKLFKN